MKTNRSIANPLILVLIALIQFTANGANTVTFNNRSGKPALVKLGVTAALSVQVPAGAKEPVPVALGYYSVKIRYGEPGDYSYFRGDAVEVAPGSTELTVILRKMAAKAQISEAEFQKEEGPVSLDENPWQKDAKLFVKSLQQLMDKQNLSPEEAFKKLVMERPAEVEWRGRPFLVWSADFGGPAKVEIQMDGLVVQSQKTNEYRISRIGLFPRSEEWKKWSEFANLPSSELAKREVVFRTTLVAAPLSYKCDGTMPLIIGVVGAGQGKVNALFSPVECGQKDSHYHLILSTRGAELINNIEPPAQ